MKTWSEKSTYEKLATVFSWTAFCVWMLFEFLGRKGVPYSELICGISIFVVCASDAFLFWNTKRYISYIAIGGSTCMIVGFILQML